MATSKLYAITHARCPRCRRGRMFQGPAYSFRAQHVNELCSHCGLRFEIEPGYFYAAMYVSYAMSTAEMVALGVLTYLVTGSIEYEQIGLYIGVVLGGMLLLAPFNFRYSRVILLHLLTPKVKYNAAFDTE
ncbi:DUF983 domain-containing protein (plasmid) [Pedobacter sp. BS3]|uniref:DUF983 domain-containing protein n=1 Tax=Pedobacter sp. BS3 TaxID=2567937 RepID=UPI0011ECBD8F|nr:DUF983 domain-containing protein [Pedobacter sp. BS3]TZF85523.1 DUF983 domain-containing protein [Pedobacter sp. BS3]